IQAELQEVHGTSTPSLSTISFWVDEFKCDRTNNDDEQYSGRPKTATNEEIVNKVLDIIMSDRCLKLREIVEMISISEDEILSMRKLTSEYVTVDETLRKKVLFHYDNTPFHSSVITTAKLIKLRYELLPYPHSPDLAPYDFFLFLDLKIWLGGKKFTWNKIIAATNVYFAEFQSSYFLDSLKKLKLDVTAKPDLYPLVIGCDDSSGKGTSSFVMHYVRSLPHSSTLDSLSSSFMCNMVNEANTIIPPPYSCNNSVDELSAVECERRETSDIGSIVSLTNHRTTSDISSLGAQSPCSPPRATSPTIELRELLDKIQQLPHLSSGHSTTMHCQQNQAPVLYTTSSDATTQQRPLSPNHVSSFKVRRTRGKLYMPLGLPNSQSKTKRWLSRSAPTTPSGTMPMSFLPGQSRRPSETGNNNQQAVPLLYEQDENEINNADQPSNVSTLAE
ncbi:hypothetical protein ALC62_15279, partial [Cyphomyrmex costatus]